MQADRTLFLFHLMPGDPEPLDWQVDHLTFLCQSGRGSREIVLATSTTSFSYSFFCSASLSSPLRRSWRCKVWAVCRAVRRRVRQSCCTFFTCSFRSPLASFPTRERTRTLSTSNPLSVGWWISVCTHVASRRSLRPSVTFACTASCTTRSLSACRVCGRKVWVQRMSVVFVGTLGKYTRQNQRNTRLSATRLTVSS